MRQWHVRTARRISQDPHLLSGALAGWKLAAARSAMQPRIAARLSRDADQPRPRITPRPPNTALVHRHTWNRVGRVPRPPTPSPRARPPRLALCDLVPAEIARSRSVLHEVVRLDNAALAQVGVPIRHRIPQVVSLNDPNRGAARDRLGALHNVLSDSEHEAHLRPGRGLSRLLAPQLLANVLKEIAATASVPAELVRHLHADGQATSSLAALGRAQPVRSFGQDELRAFEGGEMARKLLDLHDLFLERHARVSKLLSGEAAGSLHVDRGVDGEARHRGGGRVELANNGLAGLAPGPGVRVHRLALALIAKSHHRKIARGLA
mmetsp:Transcript_40531/g.120871  ORF Transcript_40531/g.120871 Transcript_40531/m.120871 type:complete len:322 (+) Transcript_40531:196-1161(+)